MATFNTVGVEDIAEQFLLRGEAAVKAVPLMLEAGARVVIAAQQAEAAKLTVSGRSRGALVKSIRADKVKGGGTAQYVDIFPHGTDKSHTRKGVRNAEKGFVLEHGRSNMPARAWMGTANAKCADQVVEAQRQEWEKVSNGSE